MQGDTSKDEERLPVLIWGVLVAISLAIIGWVYLQDKIVQLPWPGTADQNNQVQTIGLAPVKTQPNVENTVEPDIVDAGATEENQPIATEDSSHQVASTVEAAGPAKPVTPTIAAAKLGGLAAEIGPPGSAEQVLTRLDAISRRLPEALTGKIPLFADVAGSDHFSLRIGPINDPEAMITFCRTIRLQLALDCRSSKHVGINLDTLR